MTTAMTMTTPIISHRLYELIWKFMQQQGRESSRRGRMKRVGKTVGNRKIHTQIHMKLGTRCYQRPWKTCRTSWSPLPLHHPVSPHSQSSCEKQFEQKVSLNLRSRRRHRCLTHRIPPPSASSRSPPPARCPWPRQGNFLSAERPFLSVVAAVSAVVAVL